MSKILVIGSSVWGKGDTEQEAMKHAQQENSNLPLLDASVYEVPDELEVDDYGNFMYNFGSPMPKLLHRIQGGLLIESDQCMIENTEPLDNKELQDE